MEISDLIIVTLERQLEVKREIIEILNRNISTFMSKKDKERVEELYNVSSDMDTELLTLSEKRYQKLNKENRLTMSDVQTMIEDAVEKELTDRVPDMITDEIGHFIDEDLGREVVAIMRSDLEDEVTGVIEQMQFDLKVR